MDDCKLAQQFRLFRDRHDADALARVFDHLAPGLLKVARHLTQDRALAEDLLQMTFLTAMERASTYDDSRPLRPWLAGILLRHARHQMRKSARTLDATRLERGKEPDPSRIVEERELEGEVEKALETLPEKYRKLLVPRLKDGLKGSEIARRVGRSPGVVRMQIHRGLELLKKALPQSLLTALFGFLWSRRALASVRAQVLKKAAAPSAIPVASTLLVGGLAVFKSVILLTAGATLLVGASVLLFWDDEAPEVIAFSIQEETSSGAAPAHDFVLQDAHARMGGKEIEPLPPQGEGAGEAKAPEKETCLVRVLDYRGRPASGIRFVMLDREQSVESDSEGRFELPSDYPPAKLYVAPPNVMVRVGRHLEGEDWLVVVAPQIDLNGVVVDENGTPLDGVQVDVRPVRLVDFPEVLDRTTRPAGYHSVQTDERGRFEAHRLPGGCAMLRLKKRGFKIATRPVAPDMAGVQYFTLQALTSETLTLAGWVEDHAQRLVPDALIGLGRLRMRSDEQGAFRFDYRNEDIPEGWAMLFAAKRGYRTKVIPWDVSEAGALENQTEMVIRLDGPALQISGRLLDAAGEPMQGSLIMLWGVEYLDFLDGLRSAEDLAVAEAHAGPGDLPPWTVPPGSRAYSVTDRRGAFLVGGLDDRAYRLRIFDESAALAMSTAPIPAGTRNVKIRIPADAYREKMTGRVVDHQGEPVRDARVSIGVRRWQNSEDNYWDGIDRKARSDEEGYFELSRVCRLDTIALNIDGKNICQFSKRIEPEESGLDMILKVERRCYFRVELADPSLAHSFHILDENDKRLEITEYIGDGGTRGFRNTPFPLSGGKTQVVSVSDRACTLHLRGDKDLFVPVRLVPGEITVVTY
jgi:RNA polymerase sigma-70 factor (ECF subfamily)